MGKPNIEKLKAKRHLGGLVRAMGHRDSAIQEAAATALVDLADPAVVSIILARLPTAGGRLDKGTGEVMRGLGPRAVPPLLAALKQSRDEGLVIACLGFTRAPEASDPIVRALTQTGDADLRWSAAVALRNLRDPGALPILTEALADRHWGVRAAAAEGLEWLGDSRAIPALLAILGDREPAVRGAVALAIGKLAKMADRSTAEALIEALRREPDWSVRGSLVLAVGYLGNPVGRDVLLESSRADGYPAVRDAARQAIAILDDAR